jgi:hypothetical protein
VFTMSHVEIDLKPTRPPCQSDIRFAAALPYTLTDPLSDLGITAGLQDLGLGC